MTERTDQIMDAAERRIRTEGYNGFSFRDLAQDVGVKSASIHHHFPTKSSLGAAVTRRYTERFLGSLEAAPAGSERVAACIDIFRNAVVNRGLMCLGGALGAECDGLPREVAAEARNFFARVSELLAEPNGDRGQALRTLAILEGGMILARSLDDANVFDAVAGSIKA